MLFMEKNAEEKTENTDEFYEIKIQYISLSWMIFAPEK